MEDTDNITSPKQPTCSEENTSGDVESSTRQEEPKSKGKWRGNRQRHDKATASWKIPPAMGAGFPMHPWSNRYMKQGQLEAEPHEGHTRPKVHIRLRRKLDKVGQDEAKPASETDQGDTAAASGGKGPGHRHGHHEGRKRGAGRRGGRKWECWYDVLAMAHINPDHAQVKVKGSEVVITGPRRGGDPAAEEREIQKKVSVPEGVALRTIRSAWLGPRRGRLFLFALKKPGAGSTTDASEAPEPDAEESGKRKGRRISRGQRRECWFQVVNVPAVKRVHANVQVKPKKIIISRRPPPEEEESQAKTTTEKPIQVIDLPDGLARPTINTTWLGPHRLCVFALKKPQKPGQNDSGKVEYAAEQTTDDAASEESSIKGAASQEEDVELKPGSEDEEEERTVEELIEEAALISSFKHAKDNIEKEDGDELVIEDDDGVSSANIEEKVPVDTDTITETLLQKCVIGSPSIESSQAGFQINIDVSGYEAGDISVNVDGHYLVVSARHEDDKEGEICEYQFKRGFPLSENVDTEHMRVTVDQESGILHITAPSKLTEADQDTWTIPIEYLKIAYIEH